MGNNKNRKERIMEVSQQLFMKYSISRVTVKEIASKAGVSKKTIYNYFDSKEELQKEVVKVFLETVTNKVNNIYENNKLNFYGKIENWISFASKFLFQLNKVFLEDVQNNYPELWQMIEKYRKENILKMFSSIINCGKEEGYVKKNIDEGFISELFYRNIRIVTDADFIYNSKYSIKGNIVQFVEVFFNGLLRDENNFNINL